ncbi:hypothetical protein EXU85_00570 [Spirosoma sp. KCTC 42546]|uniref:hypothetical protein n=1 Tax=Spirosoma sp. KCTC 42546 TaxID=2520506 RepID=UPI00115B0CE7|nr:hypothetical protein [Spirosoma sp. KCTC 42546]QDK77165.1 hypothetical protein EXU85_00570 [Spirosoma sp. KCTC 42546]
MRTKSYNSPTYWQPFTKTEETSQWVTGINDQLKQATHRADAHVQLETGHLAICLTTNSFWLLYTIGKLGQLAIRTCFDPQMIKGYKVGKISKTKVEYLIEGALGQFQVTVELPRSDYPLLRYTTSLTPNQPFTVQAFPQDVYVLDKDYNPATTQGMVYVTQSGPTSGLAYLSVAKPAEGSLVYFQNFTALNDYFQTTETEPSGTVSVQWPEVGFALPAATSPLPAGQELTISDAFLYLSDRIPQSEFEAADQFLDAMASIYLHLPKSQTQYYHWPKAAERTIEALSESADCGRMIKKHFYLNAYVDATYKPPESMVQLAILVPLWEYQHWSEKPVPLVESLQQSLPSFYDENRQTLMRWLPGGTFTEDKASRSEEQDPAKIDSWYLLHTLMNLGRLAHQGNAQAKDLLVNSLEFVIKAAHHFNYDWPVFYDVRTLEVVKAETDIGKGGELDVAGLYTHVMVQVYEFTKEARYLDEAIASAERLRGKGFELLYQSNITIMSALTLAKLWKITGNRLYFDLSRLGLANVIARLWIWDCQFGFGTDRSTFLGVAPLRDAPYLAAYEEGEIVATMINYLKEVGRDVPDSIRLFFSEYMKYLLHRGRYYYPSELAADSVSQSPKEGRIIHDLPIPLEDMPTGWKQAGSVGQEVYGGALAYILTSYAYKRFPDVPIMVFLDYPVYQAEYQLITKTSGYAVIRLAGTSSCTCRVRLFAKSGTLPTLYLYDEDAANNEPLKPSETAKTYQEYQVQGHLRLRLEWNRGSTGV